MKEPLKHLASTKDRTEWAIGVLQGATSSSVNRANALWDKVNTPEKRELLFGIYYNWFMHGGYICFVRSTRDEDPVDTGVAPLVVIDGKKNLMSLAEPLMKNSFQKHVVPSLNYHKKQFAEDEIFKVDTN
jgi:hypothetical protein